MQVCDLLRNTILSSRLSQHVVVASEIVLLLLPSI